MAISGWQVRTRGPDMAGTTEVGSRSNPQPSLAQTAGIALFNPQGSNKLVRVNRVMLHNHDVAPSFTGSTLPTFCLYRGAVAGVVRGPEAEGVVTPLRSTAPATLCTLQTNCTYTLSTGLLRRVLMSGSDPTDQVVCRQGDAYANDLFSAGDSAVEGLVLTNGQALVAAHSSAASGVPLGTTLPPNGQQGLFEITVIYRETQDGVTYNTYTTRKQMAIEGGGAIFAFTNASGYACEIRRVTLTDFGKPYATGERPYYAVQRITGIELGEALLPTELTGDSTDWTGLGITLNQNAQVWYQGAESGARAVDGHLMRLFPQPMGTSGIRMHRNLSPAWGPTSPTGLLNIVLREGQGVAVLFTQPSDTLSLATGTPREVGTGRMDDLEVLFTVESTAAEVISYF